MLDNLPVVISIAAVLGFLAGLGVGGGSLLILWLTLIVEMPYPKARVINLSFFIPCAIIATVFRWKQGKLNIKEILPAIIAGSISAAVFSIISNHIDLNMLKKLFGGILIFTGIKEIFYRQRNAK